MARKLSKDNDQPKQPARLLVELEVAREKIEKQIKEAEDLIDMRIGSEQDLKALENESHIWSDYTEAVLRNLFTSNDIAEEFNRFYGASIDMYATLSERIEDQRDFLSERVVRLKSVNKRLELLVGTGDGSPKIASAKSIVSTDDSTVFLVHGHDESTKAVVMNFLNKLGFKAVVLHEQANQGMTIIEKFEHHSNVPFAIVLLTPDDVGAEKAQTSGLQPRARQNVVLELGYFFGKLGRKNVVAILKDAVEVPSDLDGILYVSMNPNESWKLELAKEMKAAGLRIDMNKLF